MNKWLNFYRAMNLNKAYEEYSRISISMETETLVDKNLYSYL